MGGIIIAIAVFFSVLITAQWEREMLFILVSILGFGFIGLVDDFIKIVMRRSLGLRATHKLAAQVLLAAVLTLYAYRLPGVGSSVLVPFTSQYWDMGVWYLPFTAIIIFVGTVNSVNFTDGLDRLYAGVTMIIMAFRKRPAGVKRRRRNCHNLRRRYRCLWVFSDTTLTRPDFYGGYRVHGPGGRWRLICRTIRLPLLLPIVGGVYVLETLSIIIQVVSYRTPGKGVFLMAPLHHHYEVKRQEETKVVMLFWIITIVLVLVGVLAIR